MLAAVTVTYRRPVELAATLAAVAAQDAAPDLIVVVDNDPDMSARPVVPDGAIYIAAGDNLGPAGGLPLGFHEAISHGADWVIIVDDDTPPGPGVFADLAKMAASAGDDVAAVGFIGARYNRRTGQPKRIPNPRDTVEVDWIGGGQLPMYRTAALATVEFDPGLFFGYEELALGLRLQRAGWRLIVDAERWAASRTALGRDNTSRTELRVTVAPWRQYYSARNLILIGRTVGRRTALVATAASLARAMRSRSWKALRGTVDGVLGRTGRRVDPGY